MSEALERKEILAKTLATIKEDFPEIDFENDFYYKFLCNEVGERIESEYGKWLDLDSVPDEDWWYAVDHVEYWINKLHNERKLEEQKRDIEFRLRNQKREIKTVPCGQESASLALKIIEIRETVQELVKSSILPIIPGMKCRYEVPENGAVVYDGRGIWIVQVENKNAKPRKNRKNRKECFVGYHEKKKELILYDYQKGELKNKIRRGHILDNYLQSIEQLNI